MGKKRISAALAAVLFFTGCASESTEINTAPRAVNVTKVQSMVYGTGLDYLGIVMPKETKNYAFLTGGKLAQVYVQEGERIRSGMPLASLDTSTLEINISTAQKNVDSLKSSVDTAKAALDAAELLYIEEILPEREWEAQKNQYNTLVSNYEIALNNLQQAQKSLSESTIYADADGYAMEVPFKEGEIVGGGYPVVILKSGEKMVSIGVSADDIGAVDGNSIVMINGGIMGKINHISQYPDESTRTYPVDIVFESEELVIGDMVDVTVMTGEAQACFVPIESIFNIDGLDYVYVVDEAGVVSRKQVTRISLQEDMAGVTGVEDGMTIINDGVKNIKENDVVKPVFDTEETASAEAAQANKEGDLS